MQKRRPSAAMIVAVIALVLGLGGAAIAADLSKSQVKKIAKKQANKQITKRAPGLSVAKAGQADTADIALSPVAYATVAPNGDVIEGRSRGIADSNVVLDGASAYCFDNLGFAYKTAQTTVVYDGGITGDETAMVSIAPDLGHQTDCPSGWDLEVATTQDGTYSPEPFMIWFYN